MALSVAELRNELVEKYGYDANEVKEFNKKELKTLWDESQNAANALDTAEIVEDIEIDPSTQEAQVGEDIGPTDPDWTDYVLTLFDTRELENGMPKVDGLRRVAERLMGEFSILTTIVEAPNISNAGRASVVVQLQFKNRVISGAADVFSGNTSKEFALHAVATAETRAEGRALRRALRLTKVLAAEELHNADIDEPNGIDGRVPESMINGLNIMCDRLGVDIVSLAIQMGYDIAVPRDLTQAQGLAIADRLSKFQRKEEEIPNVIKR